MDLDVRYGRARKSVCICLISMFCSSTLIRLSKKKKKFNIIMIINNLCYPPFKIYICALFQTEH